MRSFNGLTNQTSQLAELALSEHRPGVMLYATVLTCLALGWLVSRAWNVLRTPVQDLVKTLGIELPTAPIVSLHGIKADQITLQWSRPELTSSVAKHFIQVNGVTVGESSRSEHAVTVTGLKPDHIYNVRVIAASAGNFQAPSRLIRLRTSKAQKPTSGAESLEIHTHESAEAPSPPQKLEPVKHDKNECYDQSIQQLATTLERLRVESQDVECQGLQAEEEFETGKAALLQERDNMKSAQKEKEDVSSDLRKEVATLDRQHRTAQSRRAAKEKLLKQKENERKKMEEDLQRWEDEIAEIDLKIEQHAKDKKEVSKSAEARIKVIRADMHERRQAIKQVEEEVKAKNAHLKSLEAERRTLGAGEEDNEEREARHQEADKEKRWEHRQQLLHSKYLAECRSWEQAYANYRQAQEQLLWWQSRHGVEPSEPERPPSFKKGKSRRSRQRKGRNSNASSLGAAPPYDNRATQDTAPTFDTAAFESLPGAFESFSTSSPVASHTTPNSPFLTLGRAITAEPESNIDSLLSIPVSPHANALLPSNLLGDEEMLSPSSYDMHTFPHLNPDSFIQDSYFPAPTSPTSSESRSPSRFSSPRGSLQHIPVFPVPEALTDDQLSLRSVGSALGAIGPDSAVHSGKRFANLFSFRQRGKTAGEPLGFDNDVLDPIGARERSGSHSSIWSSNLKLKKDAFEGNGPVPARNPRRAAPFSLFGPKLEDSPRNSISSLENSLPRPESNNSHFGWTAEKPYEADWLSMFPGRRQANSLIAPSPLANASPAQAPIGTRPNSSQALKLNPAAPTFKLFGRESKKNLEVPSGTEDGSAQGSSKDSRSVHTPSVDDPRNSLETWEQALHASEAVTPGTTEKQSFISKITRKGSSSKFNISSHWKDKGGLFSKKQPDVPNSEEEDFVAELVKDANMPLTPSTTASVGKSRTWGSLMSRKKKGDKDEEDDIELPANR